MSSSTTATTSYILKKYSRSYPKSTSGSTELEWQHFSNPVIRLVLDVKKSANGDLESLRVRIMWSMCSGPDSMDTDQRDVTFEDLDLLVYSSVDALQSQQNAYSSQGLPIKAVYRDTVVGLRYLYPRIVPPGAEPVYRRFQVTFQSSGAATKFIESIRLVCPCKANPPPTGPGVRSSATMGAVINQAPAFTERLASNNSAGLSGIPDYTMTQPKNRPSTPQRVSTQPQPQLLRPLQLTSSSATLTESDYPHFTRWKINGPISDPQSKRQLQHGSLDQMSSITGASSVVANSQLPTPQIYRFFDESESFVSRPSSAITACSDMTLDQRPPQTPTYPPPCDMNQDSSGRPHPTYSGAATPIPASYNPEPSSLSSSLDMPPPPSRVAPVQEQSVNTAPAPSPVNSRSLASLTQTPPLYDLTRPELQNLVAHVVREEGFAKLLESLDAMWKVKGALNIL